MRHRTTNQTSSAHRAKDTNTDHLPDGAPSTARKSFRHFLPIPDELFHAGIYVVTAGHRIAKPGENYLQSDQPLLYQFKWDEGRILPEFAFVLIEAGRGIFESRQTGSINLETGMVFMMFPGIWHRFRPAVDTGWIVSWMTFNGEFAHLLLDQKIISPERTIIRPTNLRETQTALYKVLDRVHADPSSNSLILSLQAIGVLATVSETSAAFSPQRPTQMKPPGDPIVAAALGFIWTSNHHALSVSDVADAVGVSRRALERHMEATLHRSVLGEIMRCRFDRAARLLRETELPSKTVAILAGFGSLKNMRRVFASQTNLSPVNYRRLHSISQRTAAAIPVSK